MARFSHEWNHFLSRRSWQRHQAHRLQHQSSQWLVGGFNKPLWKMMEWVRQLGWFSIPNIWKKIQTTNQISINHHYPPLTTNQMIIISRFSKVLQEADIIAAPMLHPLQHGESQRSWHRSTLSAGEFSCKPCVITRCAIHIVRQCTSTCIMYIYNVCIYNLYIYKIHYRLSLSIANSCKSYTSKEISPSCHDIGVAMKRFLLSFDISCNVVETMP